MRWLIVPVCAQGAANVVAFCGQFSAVALQEVEVDQHAAWTAERKWAGWMRQAEAASETDALLVLLGVFPQEVFQPLLEREEWASTLGAGTASLRFAFFAALALRACSARRFRSASLKA